MKSPKILFIADEWQTLDHERDSTLYLARTVMKSHGAECTWATPSDIYFDTTGTSVRAVGKLKLDASCEKMLEASAVTLPLSDFHSVHWRMDPPVDLKTMRLWALLASTNKAKFINPPAALLRWNEKFAPLYFSHWAIPSLVADSEHAWESFFKKHTGKKLIAKPSGDAASRGVQILSEDWNKAKTELLTLQKNFGPWLVLQDFDSKIQTQGETRVFLIDGKICGSLNKKPHPDQQIINLDAEPEHRPTVEVTTLTPEQQKRAQSIAQELTKDGVYIATLDFIGDRILEINVTSPGLLLWFDEHKGGNLAEQYWKGLF